MPRVIYKDKDGKRVPSVTSILSRFKDSGGLLYWANQKGLDGKTLEEARAPEANAGTLAHDMVEGELNKRKVKMPDDKKIVAKAKKAFDAYIKWQDMTALKVMHTEVSLVSDKYKVGGRLDAVGVVGNEQVLVDWKTGGVYSDHILQLAAYKLIWEENYPDQPLVGGAHLCSFNKDTGDFSHKWFGDLEYEVETFILMREMYTRVKEVDKRVK